MGAVLERVRRVFGDTESDLIRLRLQVLEGMVAYYRDDWAGAERLFTATCPGLRRLGLKPDLWQARRFQGWCAARLGRPAAECEALSRETHDLVTELADTLSPAQQVIYLVNKWTVEERRLAFDIERLKRAKAECQRGPWFLRPGGAGGSGAGCTNSCICSTTAAGRSSAATSPATRPRRRTNRPGRSGVGSGATRDGAPRSPSWCFPTAFS